MCGVAAIYAYAAGANTGDSAALHRMCDRLACRGPDGMGVWTSDDGRVQLGHRRLAILDLSDRGAQPMGLPGEITVTFNGEIYNFKALRAELEKKGHRFASDSDTEVLLHLYLDRGEEMVRALRGMFAFALWD